MRRVPLLLTFALSLPAAAAELPVRSIILSNAGLAQIERAGMLPAGASVTFAVPARDVDDVLKSLVVRDPAGTVQGVRLPAQDLAEEAFSGLPLRPADFESRAALLRALRGQPVEAGGAAGRLADVGEDAEGGLRLTLVTSEGLRLLVLREGDEVRLGDPALAGRVARAAEALAAARAADRRELEIHLSGAEAARAVSVTTVTGAPLWKPSWRLVLPAGEGEARLQGWAVVENRSGADWEGVRLSLVSGHPAAFRQPLYTPLVVPRPELPVRLPGAVGARPDPGARPAPPPMPRSLAAMAPAPRDAGPAEAARAPYAAVPAAEAASSPGRVAFTLPGPVSLRGGETANLPFLDAALPAERLWWVQEVEATNPLQAVRLRNTTPHVLPDGIATLYGGGGAEDGAYLGDAELLAMAPGEARLLGFARDRDLRMTSATGAEERPVRVAFRRGFVLAGTIRREETALAIDPSGARGRIVLDLPRRPGFTPRFAVAEEGDFGLRHEAALDGTPQTLRFAWEQEGQREIRLWDPGLGDPLLLRWREMDAERDLSRLPGAPGTLEALRDLLGELRPEAPGREALAALVEDLAEARRLLDAARTAIRRHVVAEEALRRARDAAEDRTGAAREEARRALNAASITAERAGAEADAAWEAWRRAAQAVLARTG